MKRNPTAISRLATANRIKTRMIYLFCTLLPARDREEGGQDSIELKQVRGKAVPANWANMTCQKTCHETIRTNHPRRNRFSDLEQIIRRPLPGGIVAAMPLFT